MAESGKSVRSGTADVRRHFVLIVGPDGDALSFLSVLLQRFNYQILKAPAAAEAMSMLNTLNPSLVIISLDSRDMNGFELMQQLKLNPASSHIPLIGLMNQYSRDTKIRCKAQGAVGYLSLPFDADGVFRTLQLAIEKNPRSSMRVRAVLPVKVHSRQYDSLYGAYTLALSTGGMFLRTMNPVAVNTEITLELDLNGKAIAAGAVVLYNCQNGAPCGESGIGLRFVDISTSDRESIRTFIQTEVTKGISCRSN